MIPQKAQEVRQIKTSSHVTDTFFQDFITRNVYNLKRLALRSKELCFCVCVRVYARVCVRQHPSMLLAPQ